MERHELNQRFEWLARTGPFSSLSADQVHQFDEQGYVLVEDVLDTPTIETVVEAIDPIERLREEQLERAGGSLFIARAGEITFSTHLVLESDVLRAFVARSELAGICTDLVGPDVRLYWDQAVYKKPGTASPFPWHQDNGYTFIEPQQYLTCWIALTDATEENGCPWVVPGAHTMGTLAHAYSDIGFVCMDEPSGAVAVPARKGSVVCFSSLTPHCTGPNSTSGVRKAYIVQYAPEGAEVVRRAPDGALTRTAVADPGRQFPILRDGAVVAA